MITLYTSGSYFRLPDPSPFVVKAMMLFKMAGIAHETRRMSFKDAPKGKVPYLRDGDLLLGDSHFIARHLERSHAADFSGGYGPELLAQGWAMGRMMEEHFYFLNVHERWMNDANFNKGPRQFFDTAPALLRPTIRAVIRRKVAKMLQAQGLGRHTDNERLQLAAGDLNAIEALLGDKPYMLGPHVSEVDACVFPFVLSAGCRFFQSRIGETIRARPRLMAYLGRVRDGFFPEVTL